MSATRRRVYKKLVRDRIPEIISNRGAKIKIRTLNDTEYLKTLKEKLVEEAQELQAAKPNQLTEELADVMEVMDSLIAASKLDLREIKKVQTKKRAERGGFKKRIFLESVEE